MNQKTKLIEGIDYTINKNGNWVFTEEFHLKRGYCCQSGCMKCPYGYKDKVDPNIPAEFINQSWNNESDYYEYEDLIDEESE